MELLASGRTAEVFAWADGRVLKLDRAEWNGLSAIEASVLAAIAGAGVPAPRAHEQVVVGERHGVVLDRVDGPVLSEVIAGAGDVDAFARTWTEMHVAVNDKVVVELPDLVTGLADGIRRSGLAAIVVEELVRLLADLDDGRRALCHFDLHPGNVIVARSGWVVIDWMTASSGPPDADFARTLVLDPPASTSVHGRFMSEVQRRGIDARRIARDRLDGWIRVVAGARISEGFEGGHAAFLTELATGDRRIGE